MVVKTVAKKSPRKIDWNAHFLKLKIKNMSGKTNKKIRKLIKQTSVNPSSDKQRTHFLKETWKKVSSDKKNDFLKMMESAAVLAQNLKDRDKAK